jgi:hypothetical protein
MEHKTKPETPHPAPVQIPTAEQQLFVGTLLTLSWQLLIVVVLPLVGGHFMDDRYNTTPLYTLLGLGLALSLAALVTYRGYQTLARAHYGPKDTDD